MNRQYRALPPMVRTALWGILALIILLTAACTSTESTGSAATAPPPPVGTVNDLALCQTMHNGDWETWATIIADDPVLASLDQALVSMLAEPDLAVAEDLGRRYGVRCRELGWAPGAVS